MIDDGTPFLVYRCHCSHCRNFASRYATRPVPFHAAAAVWRWNAAVAPPEKIEYEDTTSCFGLLGLSRGRCVQCHHPVWERGTRLMMPYTMVAADILGLEPNTNLFYNSGPCQQQEHSTSNASKWTTIHTDIGSLCYEIAMICCVALPRLPWSLYRYYCRDSSWNNHQQKVD